MKIEVTQEDILSGKQHSCVACPIALAITRAIKLPVSVAHSYVMVGTNKHNLPRAAMTFIDTFDCGLTRHCEPFTFKLDYP